MSEPGVRFGRLEQRGLLLGLSGEQVVLCAIALVVVVFAEYTSGVPGVIAAAAFWAPTLAGALVSVLGRPIVAWIPIWAGYLARRQRGGARQRVVPTTRLTATAAGPRPLRIPGAPPKLTLWSLPDAGQALVHDPGDGTLTGVLRVDPAGFLLADPGIRDGLVGGWGQLLAGLAHQPTVVRVQVLARTVAGGVGPLQAWWASIPTRSGMANQVIEETIAQHVAAAVRTETLLAVAVRPTRLGRVPSAAALSAAHQVLVGIAGTVAAAGLTPRGWLDSADVRHAARIVFDPASHAARDLHPIGFPEVGVALDEQWRHVRTDSGVHAVYWIAEWPRFEVDPGFLQPVLLGGTARRTLSLTMTPVPTGRAMRDIRRARVEHAADAGTRTRTGRVEDEAHRAEAADVARRESDLVAGHADLRFVGLLTVTADTEADLDAACVATEAAAAQGMCEVRRLAGQQAHAFLAGALPLARSTS